MWFQGEPSVVLKVPRCLNHLHSHPQTVIELGALERPSTWKYCSVFLSREGKTLHSCTGAKPQLRRYTADSNRNIGSSVQKMNSVFNFFEISSAPMQSYCTCSQSERQNKNSEPDFSENKHMDCLCFLRSRTSGTSCTSVLYRKSKCTDKIGPL